MTRDRLEFLVENIGLVLGRSSDPSAENARISLSELMRAIPLEDERTKACR